MKTFSKENLLSMLYAAITVSLVLGIWSFASRSVPTFLIFFVGFMLIFSVGIVYETRERPVFELPLWRFAFQSAPIAASSALCGWVLYGLFASNNISGPLEESFILLLINEVLVVSSIANLSAATFPPKEKETREDLKNRTFDRLKLTLRLILLQGIVAFSLGYLAAMTFKT